MAVGFVVGPALGVVILYLRRTIPESPRWLITHGHVREAEEVASGIEAEARAHGQALGEVDERQAITLRPEKDYGYLTFLRLVFRQYTRRAILGASLMIAQSFLYNAIFFTYALVLTHFYGVSATFVPAYGLAFAVGNLSGPLLLGNLFDTWGRKTMIAGTYIVSGTVLAISAWLFSAGLMNAGSQTAIWILIFFFASAGASSAYLTVSEIFPIEIRAEAIAVFFAISQVFGTIAPVVYGALIGTGASRRGLTIGYLVGGGIMILGGLVEVVLGVRAERKSLEAIARPLTAAETS